MRELLSGRGEGRQPPARGCRGGGARGFTLVELMVVVTIAGVLASIAAPRFLTYLLEGRVSEPKPVLMEIAARQRAYRMQTGRYCCTGDTYDENVLNTELGVRLETSGNFCFAVVCRDAAICAGPKTTAFIVPKETADPQPEFEVWAILRADEKTLVPGPNSMSCSTATNKLPPTGWVREASSGEAGREGRAVVLRYPAPRNGISTATGAGGLRYQWIEGLSTTHAIRP